jgi:hypothetical protein
MKKLREWLQDHTAEDLLKARRVVNAVYAVRPGQNLQMYMTTFSTHRVQNLMIRSDDGKISWLRLEDVLRLYYSNRDNFGTGYGYDDDGDLKRDSLMSVPAVLMSLTDCVRDLIWRWNELDWLPPIVLLDDGNEVSGVVTVADLLHYLYIYGYHLSWLVKQPASRLDWTSTLPLLYEGETAESGLGMLLDESSSGVVGLTDRRGTLVGNMTFQCFAKPSEDLDLSLREYLYNLGDSADYSLVTCGELLTYGDVLKKILQHQAHHVWRLDEYGQPIGIVHLRQLLSFIKQCAEGK